MAIPTYASYILVSVYMARLCRSISTARLWDASSPDGRAYRVIHTYSTEHMMAQQIRIYQNGVLKNTVSAVWNHFLLRNLTEPGVRNKKPLHPVRLGCHRAS